MELTEAVVAVPTILGGTSTEPSKHEDPHLARGARSIAQPRKMKMAGFTMLRMRDVTQRLYLSHFIQRQNYRALVDAR
jgi:hypothetical protein